MREAHPYYDKILFIETYMEKFRGIFKNFLIILILAREIFPYALLFYLILFLLENLFPGFVSNNFSLNWVLVTVLASGLLAAFAPEEVGIEPEKPAGIKDYLLVGVLAIAGSAVIYAKLETGSVLRWATTVVSAIVISLVGIVTLTGGDEETEEFGEAPQSQGQDFAILRRIVRQILTYRVQLPLAYILLLVVMTGFLIPENIALLVRAVSRPAPAPTETAQLEPSAEPFFWDDVNQFVPVRPSENLQISILNGGAESSAAASFSALLRDNGFGSVVTGNADRDDYTNAQIRFFEADKPQANIIKRLLQNEYPMIMELPADATSSGITVILGTKEKTQ